MSVRVPFPAWTLERRKLADVSGGWGRGLRTAGSVCGTWKCVLTTHSPLCIKTLFADCRSKRLDPYVPGSSLRGMFRNIVQVTGAGCTLDYGDAHGRADLDPCTLANGLCLACRLFGTVGTSKDSQAWAGKVRVRDSERVPIRGRWEEVSILSTRDPATLDHGDGWILFNSMPMPYRKGEGLVCVPANTKFRFAVEFDNLDAEEAAVLQFAVTLQHGGTTLVHKLGFGKALGLGTVEVDFDAHETCVDEAPMDKYAHGAAWEILTENRQ